MTTPTPDIDGFEDMDDVDTEAPVADPEIVPFDPATVSEG